MDPACETFGPDSAVSSSQEEAGSAFNIPRAEMEEEVSNLSFASFTESNPPATPNTIIRKPSKTQLRGIRLIATSQGACFGTIPAESLMEYEWPPKSGERFFLQEQIMEYLDVKSFRRKYPDLARRPVDPNEREFIKEKGLVSETQADLGLTAIPSGEIVNLMRHDYPAKYGEYQKAVSDRSRQELVAKHEEMKSIREDSAKLAELRQKALLAASDWNGDLNRERKRERRGFWDIQTMRIQYPSGAKKVRCETDFGAYPVAIIAGQFQEHYQKYSPEEMRKLPLKTVMNAQRIVPLRRVNSPPPIVVNDSEFEPGEEDAGESGPRNPDMAAPGSRGEKTEEHCAFCEKDLYRNDRYVECQGCGSCGHPTCMEMPSEMYRLVKAYEWLCMECKPCSVCSNLDQEDKMMFCDLCDRGYHTFCVGLEELPTGRWVCEKFCKGLDVKSEATAAAVGNKCKECAEEITRETKIHHRSKYRHSGLCSNCVGRKLN